MSKIRSFIDRFVGSKPSIRAVVVQAMSYSGTTWLNLLLGSHPQAFVLGPPTIVWSKRTDGFDSVCRVHGRECPFWRQFSESYDPKTGFLKQLGQSAGASHIIFDNPDAAFSAAEIEPRSEVTVENLTYVRDGRAITASFSRKNPSMSYLETIVPSGWIYHSFLAFEPTGMVIRYEDAARDPLNFIKSVGGYLGLEYGEDELEFWKHQHHITSGNEGPISMVRMQQMLDPRNWEGRDYYESEMNRVKSSPGHPSVDERWREQLSQLDLFYFDLMLGRKNAEFGYERSEFPADSIDNLIADHLAQLVETGVELPLDAVRRSDVLTIEQQDRILVAQLEQKGSS